MLLLGLFYNSSSRAQVNTVQAIETGRSAMFFSDYVTAIRYFTLAIDTKPYLSEAYYSRATAYFQLGDYVKAEADLTRAIMFNPFHVEYYDLRGLTRIYNEKYKEAAYDYTNVLKELPENQNAYFNRALCYYELQDYAAATLDLDCIIRRWPKFARVYVVKAQTCLEMTDTLQGLYWIDALLKISKSEPNAWSVKGRYALNTGDFSLADSCFTQALRYDAGNVNYYLHRALARYSAGHVSNALNDYGRVLAIAPDNPVALHNKEAIVAFNKGKNKKLPSLLDVEDVEVRSFMEEFKGKVTNHATERVFLPPYRADGNHLCISGGRHPVYCGDEDFLAMINNIDTDGGVPLVSALARIRAYVAANPDDAILLYNLGCLEVEAGTLEDAQAAFGKAMTLDPLLAEAYYNKAVAHLLKNENDVAKPLLSKAGDMGIVKAFAILNQLAEKEN